MAKINTVTISTSEYRQLLEARARCMEQDAKTKDYACLRCKTNLADYCASCIQKDKQRIAEAATAAGILLP